jgi:site-specific recombinase XerD
MSAKIADPYPLYPPSADLKELELEQYPQLRDFLAAGEPWWQQHWLWGHEFLSYISRNKSPHTFLRFRNEAERFLLWCFLAKQKPAVHLKKSDILDYADFCWQPPVNWICLGNYEKFLLDNGTFRFNPAWAPFKLKQAKNTQHDAADKRKYTPSQQTLQATFTALVAFYKFLMAEEYAAGNPAQLAKHDCKYFVKDAQVSEVRRLTQAQWDYVMAVAEELAATDRSYERSLFIISALKTLFLRVSELSEQPHWIPIMGHFWEDSDGSWWLKVFGKGRKIRDVTVPNSFLTYLQRYRRYRGLSALPAPGENQPLVEKIRGQGGMTSRQLIRIVQEVFDQAFAKMSTQEGALKARKLQQASSHWLRHTGASMEIERGRALKDLSEDLGHSSMSTTDTIYVQTENKLRAQSGRNRKV